MGDLWVLSLYTNCFSNYIVNSSDYGEVKVTEIKASSKVALSMILPNVLIWKWTSVLKICILLNTMLCLDYIVCTDTCTHYSPLPTHTPAHTVTPILPHMHPQTYVSIWHPTALYTRTHTHISYIPHYPPPLTDKHTPLHTHTCAFHTAAHTQLATDKLHQVHLYKPTIFNVWSSFYLLPGSQ